MHHVLDLAVAFPLLAGLAVLELDVVTREVTAHETQARNAQLGEVVVVTCLPGAFFGAGKIVDLHEVDQVRVAAIHIREGAVAGHVLVAGAELMAIEGIAEQAVEGGVVDLAAAGGAGVVADRQAQIGGEGAGAHRARSHQAEEVLAVHVVELGEVIAAGDLVGELVVHAAEIEVLAGGAAEETAVLVVEGDVLVVGVVAVLGLVETATGEHQVLELFRGDQAAVEGLRQDAAVVGLEDRQFGDQRADFQLGGGDLHFAGQAQLGILVGGAAIVVGGQQAGAGAVGAGVELDAEHAQRIHAKADGAVGVA